MTPPYHALTFDEPDEAAAFVAALSRWLASPSGEVWAASNPSIDVRAVKVGERVLAIYLNQPALDATIAGFGTPTRMATVASHEDIPTGLQLLDEHRYMYGLDDIAEAFTIDR